MKKQFIMGTDAKCGDSLAIADGDGKLWQYLPFVNTGVGTATRILTRGQQVIVGLISDGDVDVVERLQEYSISDVT